MRFLHTADWHVGKVLKGRTRTDEHAAVLREIVEIAHAEDVDATLVAGDVFDTAAPAPESQALVMRTLLALREGGRAVVVIAGNHDNPHLLDVYRPVLGALGIHVLGTFGPRGERGAFGFTTRTGEPVRVAGLPFLSHRYAVRAIDALTGTSLDHTRAYSERIRALLAALSESFLPDAVNLTVAHATLPGARFGGGEREAQSLIPYYVEAAAFPRTAQYAALGHLHRCQRVAGPCPIWYAGAPLAVDFGDAEHSPAVLVGTAEPGGRARVRRRRISSARELRTVHGTLDQLEGLAPDLGEAWLRVVVAEKPRVGLAEAVRQILPGALEVDVAEALRPTPTPRRSGTAGPVRSPRGLFQEYLRAAGRDDERVIAMFDRLSDLSDPGELSDSGEFTGAGDLGDGEAPG